MLDFDTNNDPSKWVKMHLNREDRDWIRFENAEWNFLDSKGKSVFTEPFEFS